MAATQRRSASRISGTFRASIRKRPTSWVLRRRISDRSDLQETQKAGSCREGERSATEVGNGSIRDRRAAAGSMRRRSTISIIPSSEMAEERAEIPADIGRSAAARAVCSRKKTRSIRQGWVPCLRTPATLFLVLHFIAHAGGSARPLRQESRAKRAGHPLGSRLGAYTSTSSLSVANVRIGVMTCV